jgi:mitogen-activated protein kinase 1/3
MVAIKKFLHLYRDIVDSRRILREIAILRRVKHPNIVKLLNILIPNESNVDSIYLVLEVLDTDLKSILHNPKTSLSEIQVKKLTLDILSGLDYIHKCGLIHRDLKPGNIVVNLNTCEAKICDFGLSRDMTLEFDTKTLIKIFFQNNQENPQIDLNLLQKYLYSSNRIPPNIQEFLNDNLEILSDSLFRLFCSGQQVLTPRNLLKTINSDDSHLLSKDYYKSYETECQQDSHIRKSFTPHVITRWYRSPEIILLEPIYSSAVDVWSIGCVFGELLGKIKGNTYNGPLFPGQYCHPLSPMVVTKNDKTTLIDVSHDDQLLQILKFLGTPSEEDIEFIQNLDALRYLKNIQEFPCGLINSVFSYCSPQCFEFLQGLLKFSPIKRFSVTEALEHNYLNDVKKFLAKPNTYSPPQTVCLEFDADKNNFGFEELKELFLKEYREFHKSCESDVKEIVQQDVEMTEN